MRSDLWFDNHRVEKGGIDDAAERPHHATITPDPWDDLQADVIDTCEGKMTMLVMTITSVPHVMATIWVRWITHVIVVV